ncbi:MAG: hypothetical protein JWN04_5267 [Myxococcaceae bacterium]|nr:hypothetical protein [Myxococcaceae bacterium]
MQLSSGETLLWTARLLSLSLVLQTLELLHVRAAFGELGSFPWSVLRRDFAGLPAWSRRVLDALLPYPRFMAVLSLQLAAALALPWAHGALCPLLLLCTTLLVCVRFRGTYNGGSDSMTIVVLLALCVARASQELSAGELWIRASLGYIAAQLLLSYSIAGVAKLRHESWRRGRALGLLVRVRQYYVPASVERMLAVPGLARCGGWLVLLFELSAPLTLLVGPRFTVAWLAVGLSFHLLIAVTLGLNRFLWAWLAAYPALLFWSAQLR